jgi:hypothetical protein
MYNKWSYELLNKKLNDLGYMLVDEIYSGYDEKITVIDTNGYYYYILLSNFLKHKPRCFDKSNPYTIQNIKLWCNLNNKPFELISNKYTDAFKKLKWKCLKEGCGEIFEMNWADASSNRGCGYCHGLKVGLSNCLATKNPKLALEWHPTLNGNLTPYDVTWCSARQVIWKCIDCGHEWKSSISNRNAGRDCPKCSEPKGETRVKDWLNSKNIKYLQQKVFDGLVGINNGNLSYDFYLSEYNLLIEYQGNFHDGSGHNDYTKRNLKRQKEHDRRKREYATINNIKLLEIWYYDFQNIEDILQNILSSKEVSGI